MIPEELSGRLASLRAQIAAAATRAGRAPGDVTLIAVTKSHPPETVQAAHAVGLRNFGENRVAELLEKRERLVWPEVRWHFIGSLQRRKVRDLVGQSALLHSLDRLSLAEEVSRRGEAAAVCTDALLQVNASGEESKGGWEVLRPAERDAFFREVEQMLALPALRLRGLMTMAPFYADPERTRPTFAAIVAVQRALQEHFPDHEWSILSMGMSNDFSVAIEEGATHVRVGTSLFGPRNSEG